MTRCPSIALLALLGVIAGCTPPTEREQAYIEEKRRHEEQRESLRSAIVDSARDEDVLKMVQEARAPDGDGLVPEWVDRQLENIRNLVMFPRWEVLRRGSNRYEVRYTFTQIDGSSMTKRGFYWNVDVVLKLVSSPRDLTPSEVVNRQRTEEVTQQQRRRIREHELSLE